MEDTTWLSTEADFDGVFKLKEGSDLPRSFLMDRFYRAMRKKTGILMHHAEPVGDSFSFDVENRQGLQEPGTGAGAASISRLTRSPARYWSWSSRSIRTLSGLSMALIFQ